MMSRIPLSIAPETERQGSPTAAVDVPHVSQPVLGHSVKKLEQQSGIANRTFRGVREVDIGLDYLRAFVDMAHQSAAAI